MTTPNKTGSDFEQRCTSVVQEYRNHCTRERVYWAERNWYTPDLVTEKELFEFKYQQVGGSVKNKLTQALYELEYMSQRLGKPAVLVYEGDVLVDFINRDPAFNAARLQCPTINLLPFSELNDYLSESVDSLNGKQEGYVEYTTACAV